MLVEEMLQPLMKQAAKPSKRKVAANKCSNTDCQGNPLHIIIDDEDAETTPFTASSFRFYHIGICGMKPCLPFVRVRYAFLVV